MSDPERSRYGGMWAAGQPNQPTATMPSVQAGAPAGAATARVGAATQRRGPRRARLVLARVDPWSVMKLAFLLSIALAIVWIVAVIVLWSVLDGLGVFDAISRTLIDITRNESGGGGVDLQSYLGLPRVVGVTAVLSLVNVVLMTALATLAAFLYNLAASLVGGLHVTLSEDV